MENKMENKILYCGFNQDNSCFACGTTTGFYIYNCDPFKLMFQRKFANTEITYVEMLFRCNLLALVGNGQSIFSPKKVIIWDDHQNKAIGELSFRSEVKAVKLSRTKIVVVLTEKTYIYNFSDLKLKNYIETYSNPRGLVSFDAQNDITATLGLTHGHVRIDWHGDLEQKTQLIIAHQMPIAIMYLKENKVATGSERGTLIRVWSIYDASLLFEFRRGSDVADFHSLSFNSDWLICSTNKSTIHIFSMVKKQDTRIINPKSRFHFISPLIPYFGGEWSFAQCMIPNQQNQQCQVWMQDSNMILVIGSENGMNGTYYKMQLDEKTASCSTLFHFCFFPST